MARALLANNWTLRKMEKALVPFVDRFPDEAAAIEEIIDAFIEPAADIKARKIPSLTFFTLLVSRLGTAWPAASVDALLRHLCPSGRYKPTIVFLLLHLDGICFTMKLLSVVSGAMFCGNSFRYIIPPRLARHMPDYTPTCFDFPDSVLERMPPSRFSDIGDFITEYHHSKRFKKIVLKKAPDDVILEKLLAVFMSAHVEFIYTLPERLYGRVHFPAIKRAAGLLIHGRNADTPLDVDAAQKLILLASPDAKRETYRCLLEDLEKRSRRLVPHLEAWEKLYPGQTVESHTCPPNWDGHTCMYGKEGLGTCEDCCMNCDHDERFSRARIASAQRNISAIEELLVFFAVPVTAKRAASAS